jgi:hypothetical protein
MPARSVKRWGFPVWRLGRARTVHFASVVSAFLPPGRLSVLLRNFEETGICSCRTMSLANRLQGQSV